MTRNVDGIRDGKMRDDRRREERARAIINPEKDLLLSVNNRVASVVDSGREVSLRRREERLAQLVSSGMTIEEFVDADPARLLTYNN